MSEESSPRFSDLFSKVNKTILIAGSFGFYVLLTAYPIYKFFAPEQYVKIGHRYYTLSDVKDSNAALYRKYAAENNDKIYRLFSQFANDKVLELEAKDRGIAVQELTKFAANYEPTEEEKIATYNQYKNNIPALKGKSYQQVQGDIASFLKRVKEDEERQAFYQQLRSKYDIDIRVQELAPTKIDVSTGDNPSIGPKDAKITIVEFSDFECPYCKRSQDVTKQLREKYQGKIRWVFRDFPLPFHQNAMFAHIAANCAIPQGKYWDYFSKLFENSGNLERSNVISLAQKSGLNMPEFQKCISDEAKQKLEIDADIAEGQKYGVNGTPAFFINGIMVEGAQPIESFTKIIDQELKN
ncbi:thioredoxin-like domain protein [Leptospira fainei serovar Hurstbridge str. BUT 6]|uniref:Thioredoxin-like domain protein n=1 Tax=Leptospira fainei serovar Hurstbridge str. BUT 6 TaxID=1193011 RepID=S3W533_9LEPT|nr:thioredoxin domain-containing protein [Leptospira fainei]EPG75362.1 thioredoxin-like domain protein [Leptospira fainei serovar Hurstbridge str. BUT 6]